MFSVDVILISTPEVPSIVNLLIASASLKSINQGLSEVPSPVTVTSSMLLRASNFVSRSAVLALLSIVSIIWLLMLRVNLLPEKSLTI